MMDRFEKWAVQECSYCDDGMCLPTDKPCKLSQGADCRYFNEVV